MTHKANGFCRMRSQIPLLPSTEFPRPTASWGGTSKFWNRTQEEPAGAPRCGRSANRFPSCLVSPRRSAVRFESGRRRTSRNLAVEGTTLVRSEPRTMTDGTPIVSAGRAFRGPRSARVDGTVRVLRSNQVGFSAFQMSTTQRISPSGSRRQIVIPRPFIVTGMPSGPSIATSLRPSMYARLPSGENVTSVEVHVIRNPGIFQLDSTYSRNAGLPEMAGSPGGKTIASSVQYDRMRSMSRPFEETAAHVASGRSSSVLADVKSNLDFPWERDDGAMTE